MKLKELIEAYIALFKLQKNYPSEFNIHKGCNHNTLQIIREKLYEKIIKLYPEFLKEPFIIGEYMIIWYGVTNDIIIYPKKEIK